MAERPTCATCYHFLAGGGHGSGECRRYPPTVMLVPVVNILTKEIEPIPKSCYPPQLPTKWCGEHRDSGNGRLGIGHLQPDSKVVLA